MLNAIIIEDEKPALQSLIEALSHVSAEVQVKAVLSSVTESIDYLSSSPEIDIIFSDVQLPDGLSFEIFRATEIKTPVIFITGYDEFMINAFSFNGIDYLLKPIDKRELEKALVKYQMLEKHFAGHNDTIKNLSKYFAASQKNRMVVRKGLEHIALKMDDIILFYTENKLVFVIDRSGRKYITDKTLSELDISLDNTRFFRANRQYIVNLNFIKGFKTFEKVKLQIDLMLPVPDHNIIVSQENAPQFKEWIYNA